MGNKNTEHIKRKRANKRKRQEQELEAQQLQEFGVYIALKDRFGNAVKLTKESDFAR